MNPQAKSSFRRVLTRQETRGWHSPFSKYLRDSRRDAILRACAAAASEEGYAAFRVYDADEILLAEAAVETPPPARP